MNMKSFDELVEMAEPFLTFHELLVLRDVRVYPRSLCELSVQEVISCVEKISPESADFWLKMDRNTGGLPGIIQKLSSLAEDKNKKFIDAIEDYHKAESVAGQKRGIRRIAIHPQNKGVYFWSEAEGLQYAPWVSGRRKEAPFVPEPKKENVFRAYSTKEFALRAIEMWKEHHFHKKEIVPHPLMEGVAFFEGLNKIFCEPGEVQEFSSYKYVIVTYLNTENRLITLRDDVESWSVKEGDEDYPSDDVAKRLHLK